MPHQKVRFISVSSGDPKPRVRDARSRRLIRTKAASAGRSHDTDERAADHHKQSIAAKTVSQRGGMNRFRAQRPSATTTLFLNTNDDVSPLDHQLPVWSPVISPLGDQAWNLLHYYRFVFRSRSWAIHAKKDWFAFIIEDPAATHATLSFVALNRDLEQGTTLSAWTLSHRYKAVQLIRRQLGEERGLPRDAMIGAVALLAITEGLEGRAASSLAHAEALAKLVSLRGGPTRLQSNEALVALVAWANLCHVSTFSNGPRPSSLFPEADDDPGSETIEAYADEQSKGPSTMKQVMPKRVFRVVNMLGMVPIYPPSEATTPEERQNVNRLIHHINQTLLLIHHEEAAFFTGPAGRLAKVLCYAAHLYISLVLRQMPRRTTVVVERAVRLGAALYELESIVVWDKLLIELYLVISLWAQTLHLCAVPSSQRQELPLVGLKSILKTLGITDLEQFNHHLGRISWVRSSFDDELNYILRQPFRSVQVA